jgi:uncharacterized protein (DUF1697 family)
MEKNMKLYEGIYEYSQQNRYSHGIVVKDSTEEIVHICLYEKSPDIEDLLSLIEEIQTDQEFGLVGQAFELNYIVKEITNSDYPDNWLTIPNEKV